MPALGTSALLLLAGCLSAGPKAATQSAAARPKQTRSSRNQAGALSAPSMIHVRCLYDTRPWLTNLDRSGDRDPEGIWFRVVLDPGTMQGVFRDGTFHIELYQIDRKPGGFVERILVSDWHYPTETWTRFSGGWIGEGYLIQLRWHDKALAGKEVEIVTQYEDPEGRTFRSGTKRFRVPRYDGSPVS